MIFSDDAFYSLKPDDTQIRRTFTSTFYKTMMQPHSIVLLVVGFIALSWREVIPILMQMYDTQDENFWVMFFLLLATLLFGARLIQSFYWANQDYSKLEYGIGDAISFGAVLLFTSGFFFVWLLDYPAFVMVSTQACQLRGS